MAMKLKVQSATKRDNVVVMGPPLSGKTTWVNSQIERKKTLFISTDGNALPGSQVAEVENWDDLMEAIAYATGREDMEILVLDVLDDAVAFAERKAQLSLGMTTGKTDAKGGYGKFQLAVGELVKEQVLRPLLMSKKKVYVVMHSMNTADGDHVPCFGSYSKDAIDILNWVKGRCGKVVRCESYMGIFDAIVESERVYEELSEEEPHKEKPAPKNSKSKSTKKSKEEEPCLITTK